MYIWDAATTLPMKNPTATLLWNFLMITVPPTHNRSNTMDDQRLINASVPPRDDMVYIAMKICMMDMKRIKYLRCNVVVQNAMVRPSKIVHRVTKNWFSGVKFYPYSSGANSDTRTCAPFMRQFPPSPLPKYLWKISRSLEKWSIATDTSAWQK
jgi:hypothetical protein